MMVLVAEEGGMWPQRSEKGVTSQILKLDFKVKF